MELGGGAGCVCWGRDRNHYRGFKRDVLKRLISIHLIKIIFKYNIVDYDCKLLLKLNCKITAWLKQKVSLYKIMLVTFFQDGAKSRVQIKQLTLIGEWRRSLESNLKVGFFLGSNDVSIKYNLRSEINQFPGRKCQ